MENQAEESYHILLTVCKAAQERLTISYKQLRDLIERLCRLQLQDESLQMTDLSARISFVATKFSLSVSEQNRLHTFRLTSNAILNRQAAPTHEHLMRDTKTLAFFIKRLSGVEIPAELYQLLPRTDATYLVAPPSGKRIQRMRVCFLHSDELYLYVNPVDEVVDTPLRVRYNVPEINSEFAATCGSLWRHVRINLLDITVDDQGVLTPSFIVLEPDYLIDISSLAECFRDYGHHPANYLLARLQPIENARPLLLGNIANLFLDEWIYTNGEVDYAACMTKAFRRYPIELAACEDLRNVEKEQQFFADCRTHFEHIRHTVTHTFQAPGYELNKQDAVLEPAYICEALGLQGRLDYMQRDMSSFIEMKSGKADEYAIRNKVEPKENNKVQMLLYQAVLQYSMGMDHRKVRAYLLYTRYPLLYPARPSWAMVRRVIDLRNRIVANEYGMQLRNSVPYTACQLGTINPTTLNERGLHGRFWEQYLCPSIELFAKKLAELSAIEQAYYYALYNFITKELYTSKSGDVNYEGRTGAASLWLSTLTEKCEAGEILYDLRIKENRAADQHKAYLILSRTEDNSSATQEMVVTSLPNFRLSDAIVLYQRNVDTDNVTNKMVFKGNIEAINEAEVRIRLRASQQNTSVLPPDSLYAIEHDSMDTAFRAMYHGLSAFAATTQSRRDLLLGQRTPTFDASFDNAICQATDDFVRVALKAQAANDYFLLVGPPGTGKTSCALRAMVETFYQQEETHILLLAYTNRAVDEVCKALTAIKPTVDFIRVGSELSCDEAYRPHLIENQLARCTRRAQVSERIEQCRIFVGTVASIAAKPELFKLKHFDVAIIDEATQILEPQLLGILCACREDDTEAIGKFILIGDHKQLPAVVLQPTAQSQVYDEQLLGIGITNLKDSLFERLYRTARMRNHTYIYDTLCKQGRMHPDVARFPNRAFYGNELVSVGLPHQLEELTLLPTLITDELSGLMAARLAFIESTPDPAGSSAKTNHSEAVIAARLAAKIYQQHAHQFNSARTLGVIAPYRSQIALIKREISTLGIAALNDILVDTVERFQGSERDVIIYSFCVNYPYQLKFLSNLTEEDGVLIDRKLNVALTRARKQLFLTGVASLLKQNPIYASLLRFVK